MMPHITPACKLADLQFFILLSQQESCIETDFVHKFFQVWSAHGCAGREICNKEYTVLFLFLFLFQIILKRRN